MRVSQIEHIIDPDASHVTMALHNHIRIYSERDRHFDDPKNFCEESNSNDDDDDEEYQNYQVEGSHETEA